MCGKLKMLLVIGVLLILITKNISNDYLLRYL